MSSQFEIFSKEFDELAAEFGLEDDAEVNALLKKIMFMNDPHSLEHLKKNDHQKAADYLRLSDSASTKKDALEYANKALSLEPNNIDAQVSAALYSSASLEEAIPKLKRLRDLHTESMKEDGYFEPDKIGHFWEIVPTRPYMRLLEEYSGVLYDCGRLKDAAEILREMLRLCESDNLGARHTLMYIYAFSGDKENARELAKRFPNDNTVKRFLPLSILYYKLGDLRKSADYLQKLRKVNIDTIIFFCEIRNDRLYQYYDPADEHGYSIGTIGEFIEEAELHKYLFASIPDYFDWAYYKMPESKVLG